MGKKVRGRRNIGRSRSRTAIQKIDPEKLRLYVKDNPDAYLREIADVFHCCPTAIRKALQRLKITRKKDDELQGTVSGEGRGI